MMLQNVATLLSLLLAAGAVAVIAGVLADDWHAVTRAFGLRRARQVAPLLVGTRPATGDRRARVVRVSAQSAPRRVAV